MYLKNYKKSIPMSKYNIESIIICNGDVNFVSKISIYYKNK